MSHNLINLLPVDRLRAFRRTYFVRLAVVSVSLAAVAILIHTVLLVPTYLLIGAEQGTREREAARLAEAVASSEGRSAAQKLASLDADASYLLGLSGSPKASAEVRAVLAAPHAGISLDGLAYAPPTGDAGNGKMTVRGVAATREALRAYAEALRAVGGIAAVDLPIGAYAKESAIDFTITLTGSFNP